MPPGLNEITQADWSGGMCRAVARHLIPEDAAYDVRDGLLDDDGNVYQRGPTTRLTTNRLAAVGFGVGGLFEAQFSAGRRLFGLDIAGSSYGVTDLGGTLWISLGNAGAVSGGGLAAQIGDLMFVPTSAGLLFYGGSRRPLPGYNTGSVTVVAGSAVVTGAGTGWVAAGIDAGTILRLPGQPAILGVVKSVDSPTQVTLTAPWSGAAAAAAAYVMQPAFVYGAGSTPSISGAVAVAAVAGRLLYATGRKVVLSNPINQDTGYSSPLIFDVDDFHEFPADIVGLATLRDVVFVFTKAGIWSISNAAQKIVDAYGNPQHRVQKVSGDVVLRSPGGLAPWRDSLVVAAVDGVYVMDAGGGLELISRSITPLWQNFMANAYIVGQVATFRDHVFVPVGQNILVGRLDRRSKSPVGQSVPWTRFAAGEPTQMLALAVQDPYGTPRLVGGSSIDGYLLDLTGVFGTGALPAAAGGRVDANGTAFGMVVETREYVLDAGGLSTVRDVAMEYESTDGTIAASAAVGQRATPNADPAYTALASTAAGNFATQNPRVLAVRREARRISYRFSATGGGVTGWRLRAVRTRSRLRGRRR